MTHFVLIFDFHIDFIYLYIWDYNSPSDLNTIDAMMEVPFRPYNKAYSKFQMEGILYRTKGL